MMGKIKCDSCTNGLIDISGYGDLETCEECGGHGWVAAQAAQSQPAPPAIVFPAEPVNDDAALESAWQTLRPQLETSGWTVSDAFNNRGFFAWGWEARHQYTPAAQADRPSPPVPSSVQEIMPLVNAYVRACGEFLISGEDSADEALKPLQDALTALVDDNHRLRFELAGVNAMRRPEWISVDERLPGPGVIVLAHFVNRLGKGRTVRAHHAPKHTIEASHWDEDVETDDTDDGSFEPEGWYEDPAVGETLAFIGEQSDGKVTHWMPLPPPPTHGIGPKS